MVQSNELRIGNWLIKDDDGLPERVSIIYPTRVKFLGFDHATGLEGVSPIPLTTQWLERAGFEYYKKQLGNTDVFYEDYRMQNLIVIIKDTFIEIEYVRNGLDINERTHIVNHIQYVHQLQNLYFALTGHELEFKQ